MPKKKPTKAEFKIVDNDAWITVHFEEIVDKYAGQHIIVSIGMPPKKTAIISSNQNIGSPCLPFYVLLD